MGAYFIRRLMLMVPTLLGITFVVFTITRFVPGGPIEQMILQVQMAGSEVGEGGGGASAGGAETTVDIPDAVLDELRAHYHFDKPFYVAYGYWLGDMLTLDFGESYKYNAPVLDIIIARFPVSVYFGLIGFTLAYLVCIPLGVLKAVKHSSTFDIASSAMVFIGYSIPGWALGALLIVLFGGGSFWDIVPLGGFRSANWEELSWWARVLDQLHHTILPVICYSIGSFATLTVLMKNSLMENLGKDYVRTAFAKGLTERRVIFVHALRNSLIPITASIGHALSLLFAGSFLIEKTCNIDGMGLMGFNAIKDKDFPIIMGTLVFGVIIRLTGNILSDLIWALIDPRIRFGK